MSVYSKFFTTKKTVLPIDRILQEPSGLISLRPHPDHKKLFRQSLAIRVVDAGSDNALEQELNALTNPYYDCERFGIHVVASPRHADILIVTGPVTRNMAEAVRKTYDATPEPNIVVAVGDGAIDGGIYRGSYAIVGGVHEVIPVHYQIPGDPPTPSQILVALLQIIGYT